MDASKEIVYQIYPRSFQDSNGDGVGDIAGITSRLDYLKDLGITTIWMNPVFPSPMKDNGYDVADYKSIHPMFGTMEEMETLIQEADKRGIKIMFDMVFNHTSTEHEWFRKALAGDPKYKDYYIWKKARPDGSLPTNWESKFGGNVWQYVPEFDEYYLHLFDPGQADLNWENPEVRKELVDVLKFWRDKGIKGFRFDVVNLISKDAYEDDFEGVGKRFYTDGKNVPKYLKQLHAQALDGADILTVGEMSATSIANCAEYTRPENKELTMAFNFHHLKVDYENGEKWSLKPFDFLELKKLFNTWDVEMEKEGGWNALFWNCHDQPRALSRFGDDVNYPKQSAKMLANVIFSRRGTPYIHYGDEIGMTNNHFSELDQYRDVESLNYYNIMREQGKSHEEAMAVLAEKSRDNGRSCMQWDSSENAGFTSDSSVPWIPINPNHTEINAENALYDPDSLYHYYQKLIDLKKNNLILQQGSTKPLLEDHPEIYAVRRILPESLQKLGQPYEILAIHNFYGKEVKLPEEGLEDLDHYEVLISSYPDSKPTSNMTLRPYESMILQKRV